MLISQCCDQSTRQLLMLVSVTVIKCNLKEWVVSSIFFFKLDSIPPNALDYKNMREIFRHTIKDIEDT